MSPNVVLGRVDPPLGEAPAASILTVVGTSEEAKQLGLPVSTAMPQEVYDFMTLFAQPTRTRSAVEYVPVPYRGARQGRADG